MSGTKSEIASEVADFQGGLYLKKLVYLLTISAIFITGCGSANSEEYEGIVSEVRANSFTLVIPVDDPEAESPAYEVKVTENTTFGGTVSSFDKLEEGDATRVKVDENHETLLKEGVIVASKVFMYKEVAEHN